MREPEHGHVHANGEEAAQADPKQALALLGYMLEHNRHHAEELHGLAHSLETLGKAEAAGLLHEALERYSGGNQALERALAALKGEG